MVRKHQYAERFTALSQAVQDLLNDLTVKVFYGLYFFIKAALVGCFIGSFDMQVDKVLRLQCMKGCCDLAGTKWSG